MATRSIRVVIDSALETYRETTVLLVWVWQLLSPNGRHKAVTALSALLLAMFVGMSVSYLAKGVVDALATGARQHALWLVLYGIGGVMIVTQLINGYQAFMRELAWSDNYRSVVTGLTRLFFMRTAGEMSSEDNEVGAEQIESAKDRIQNILYMLLFEGPTFILGMFASAVLIFTVDIIAGFATFLLIGANILWFLYFNSLVDEKMETIDKGFRRAHRRMTERWIFALSTKTNGVEAKVNKQIEDEINEPLLADRQLWAYWFIPIDLIRGNFNNIVMTGILCYGITISNWSSGDFSAVFFWLMMILDRFGYIGHLMRHLTSQVVRVRAVREVLCSEPAFRHDIGMIYQGEKRDEI